MKQAPRLSSGTGAAMPVWWRWVVVVMVVVMTGLGGLAWSAGQALADVPAQRQALILARALAYDRNLKARSGGKVVIAVLYLPGDGGSEKQRDEVVAAFKEAAKFKIQGLDVDVVALGFGDGAGLEQALGAGEVDALYLSSGLTASLKDIMDVARRKRVATMSGNDSYRQSGVSVLIVVKDNKPSLVVNLPASQAEGMDLSAELLELAEVIK